MMHVRCTFAVVVVLHTIPPESLSITVLLYIMQQTDSDWHFIDTWPWFQKQEAAKHRKMIWSERLFSRVTSFFLLLFLRDQKNNNLRGLRARLTEEKEISPVRCEHPSVVVPRSPPFVLRENVVSV